MCKESKIKVKLTNKMIVKTKLTVSEILKSLYCFMERKERIEKSKYPSKSSLII